MLHIWSLIFFFLLFNCILHKTMAKYFEKKLQGEKLMLEKEQHAQSIYTYI